MAEDRFMGAFPMAGGNGVIPPWCQLFRWWTHGHVWLSKASSTRSHQHAETYQLLLSGLKAGKHPKLNLPVSENEPEVVDEMINRYQ